MSSVEKLGDEDEQVKTHTQQIVTIGCSPPAFSTCSKFLQVVPPPTPHHTGRVQQPAAGTVLSCHISEASPQALDRVQHIVGAQWGRVQPSHTASLW